MRKIFSTVCLLLLMIFLSGCDNSLSMGSELYLLPEANGTLYFRIPIQCINNTFASETLQLTLSAPGQSDIVIPLGAGKDWGETINGDPRDLLLSISIKVPRGVTAPTDYSGFLTGTIYCPEAIDDKYFTNTYIPLRIPAAVHVVNKTAMLWCSAPRKLDKS